MAFKKGIIPWSFGKKFSKEYKKKLSDAHREYRPTDQRRRNKV